MRRLTAFILAAASVGCGGDGSPGAPPSPPSGPSAADVATIAIAPATIDPLASLRDSLELTAEARNAAGVVLPTAPIAWTSSDATIASVDGTGAAVRVIAVANGTATITARSGSASAAATVVVAQRAASVSIAPAPVDSMFAFGDSRTLTATARDGGGSLIAAPALAWSLDNAAVASVSPATGASTVLTATGNGTATVTARAGTAAASVGIVVRQRATQLAGLPAALSLAPAATSQLSVTTRDARNNLVAGLAAPSFASSDTTNVRVSAAGLVTGVAAGTATISVAQTTPDGVLHGSVAVTVAGFPASAQIAVEDFQFTPASVDIAAGGQVAWMWTGQSVHDAASIGAGPIHSPQQSSGTYTVTFPTPGIFSYLCSIHTFMTGAVTVH